MQLTPDVFQEKEILHLLESFFCWFVHPHVGRLGRSLLLFLFTLPFISLVFLYKFLEFLASLDGKMPAWLEFQGLQKAIGQDFIGIEEVDVAIVGLKLRNWLRCNHIWLLLADLIGSGWLLRTKLLLVAALLVATNVAGVDLLLHSAMALNVVVTISGLLCLAAFKLFGHVHFYLLEYQLDLFGK